MTRISAFQPDWYWNLTQSFRMHVQEKEVNILMHLPLTMKSSSIRGFLNLRTVSQQEMYRLSTDLF